MGDFSNFNFALNQGLGLSQVTFLLSSLQFSVMKIAVSGASENLTRGIIHRSD